MKKILSSPLIYPALIIIICLIIVYQNFVPGTFLTGWDTLHPEFNFPLNFQRFIFGVWRSDQGLGTVSGHSAMADLPRVFLLWLFHFVLPLNFLRYAYIFLCLFLGPLGFYYLVRKLLSDNSFSAHSERKSAMADEPEGSEHCKNSLSDIVPFLGALIYLFNLGTLQQFYLPFEMFPTQWAFLPWLILYSIKYLTRPTRSTLIIFSLLTLFSTPQAYAAHLWYPFFGLYLIFLFLYQLLNKTKTTLSLTLILSTLLINSFWLLPNIYYVATQTDNPRYNLTNRLHSQEFLLKNRATGTLADTSLIKGFYFNWDQYNFTRQTSEPLMSTWNTHLQYFDIKFIAELLMLLSFVGLTIAIITHHPQLLPLTPFFIIPFILLANRTPFFNLIFDQLIKIPLLQESFRFIFTKLSILLTFGYSLFLTYFLYFLTRIFLRLLRPILIALPISLIIFCYPFFNGQLISPIVKINIPSDYFQMSTFLQSQPPGTILTLPLHEPSGWTYTSWRYQGSGLIWFGSPQGFLDRDSDRWQATNEQAYREFRTALYAKNYTQFLNSLTKYRIGYIVWDQSVIPATPKNHSQILFDNESQTIIDSLVADGHLSPPFRFGSLFIYPTNINHDLIELKQINNLVGPSYRWHYQDDQNQADYLTTNTSQDITFPFRPILNNFGKIKPESLVSLPLNPAPETIFTGPQSITALDNTQGISLDLNLAHSSAYVVGIKSQYITGIPFRFCFKNQLTSLCTVEDETTKHTTPDWDYFLIPPQDEFSGYNLDLHLISYGHQPSSSILDTVTISPIDYSALSQISSSTYIPTNHQPQPISFTRLFPNHSLLKINLLPSPAPDSTLLLNQSFDPGWLAFYFQGLRPVFLTNHLLANNWANSWPVPDTLHSSPATIYILFWPQLLQFLGFLLLPIPLLWTIKSKPRHRKSLT